MSWLDWLICAGSRGICHVHGYRSRSYVRGVADFLSAGRICGRYVISVADVANGLSTLRLWRSSRCIQDRIRNDILE